jgi:SAM-dependent methyltransferase
MKNSYLDVVYSKDNHPPSTYPKQLIAYLRERFDIRRDSKVLDAGCGTKEFLNAFKDSGINCVGVDLFNNGDESVYECNFEMDKLPFDDNSFDYCFSKSVLEHISNCDNYLNEIYRVLVPGGKLILMVPEYDSCMFLFWDDHTHKQPYRLNTVRDLLFIHNFRDVFVQKFIQLPCVWKHPALKIVCGFLQVTFGAPKKIIKNKFVRWSRELMILSSCTK